VYICGDCAGLLQRVDSLIFLLMKLQGWLLLLVIFGYLYGAFILVTECLTIWRTRCMILFQSRNPFVNPRFGDFRQEWEISYLYKNIRLQVTTHDQN
jgi:hypothetical protein